MKYIVLTPLMLDYLAGGGLTLFMSGLWRSGYGDLTRKSENSNFIWIIKLEKKYYYRIAIDWQN